MSPLLPSRLSVVVVPLLLSRPSAFMSLPPLVESVSECMLFDFSPCILLLSWALLLGAILSVDSEAFVLGSAPSAVPVSAPFMPDGPLSRCIAPPDEAPPEGGALCCAVEPADPVSRPGAAPCAFAKPVPAIRAAAATEIKKRLVIRMSPHVFLHCPTNNERNCAMFRNIGGSAHFVL